MLWPRLSTRDGSSRAGSTGPRRDLPGRTATAAVPAAAGVRDPIVSGRNLPEVILGFIAGVFFAVTLWAIGEIRLEERWGKL